MVIVSVAACDCCLRRQLAAPLVSGHTMKSMTEEPRKPPRFFTIEQVAEELSVGIPLADRDCRR
jgi:hypothetical protein